MGIAPLVEILVGVTHGLGLAAPDHHLEIDRLEAVVLVAVDDAGGAGDAFPRAESGGETFAALVFDKDVKVALEHEKALFDLVGVRGISLSRLHIHDRQGEVLRRNHSRITVLAGATGADETVLRALVALDLGILEGRPIRLLLAEASDIFLHDVLDRNIDQFRRAWMPCNAHGALLFRRKCCREIYAWVPRSVNEVSMYDECPCRARPGNPSFAQEDGCPGQAQA